MIEWKVTESGVGGDLVWSSKHGVILRHWYPSHNTFIVYSTLFVTAISCDTLEDAKNLVEDGLKVHLQSQKPNATNSRTQLGGKKDA